MGLKISAPNLEQAVAGCQLFLANTPEQEEYAMQEVLRDLENVKKKADLQKLGVGVAASTLGSLEALLEYLKKQNIPVSYVTVGPISKDDIMKAMKSILVENPENRKKEFATMLAFDIKILDDAQKFADDNGVKIFSANIIYHLFTQFMNYVSEIQEERRKQNEKDAIWPCLLSVTPRPLCFAALVALVALLLCFALLCFAALAALLCFASLTNILPSAHNSQSNSSTTRTRL